MVPKGLLVKSYLIQKSIDSVWEKKQQQKKKTFFKVYDTDSPAGEVCL